jgi:CHAD domain-containing protein
VDTADRRLLRAGLILRLRDGDPARAARLTRLATARALPDDADDLVQPPPLDQGPVGIRVRSLVGARPLETIATVVVRRCVLRDAGTGHALEVRLDEMRAADRAVSRLTIAEAGMEAAGLDALEEALRAPCALQAAPPFLEAAPHLVGERLPPEPDLGAELIDASPSVAMLAYASLRREARAFLRCEPGVRLGDDPEAVHDMRVAGRRMRAGLDLFAAHLPKRAQALRREIGWWGRLLGAVRDLDVQIAQLASWRAEGAGAGEASFDAIERVLLRKREAARQRMLRSLDAGRYDRFVARLSSFLRAGPRFRPAIGRRPAREEAYALIAERYRDVRKAGDALRRSSAPAEFHRLRIACKRLRYALEFHRPLYDGEAAAMIATLTSLQTLLGEHQDAWIAIGQLQALASARRRSVPPQALFLMGSIAARCERRADKLRKAFPEKYGKIRGRRWKSLKAALMRPEGAAR